MPPDSLPSTTAVSEATFLCGVAWGCIAVDPSIKATTHLRKSGKAENSGDMDGLVGKLMKDQEATTAEGGE